MQLSAESANVLMLWLKGGCFSMYVARQAIRTKDCSDRHIDRNSYMVQAEGAQLYHNLVCRQQLVGEK